MSDAHTRSGPVPIFKYIRISPRKLRRFLTYLEGRNISDVKVILKFLPYKACFLFLNLIKSFNFNSKVPLYNLYFEKVLVNEGPFLKRFCPRAQGKAFPIKHRYSHIINFFILKFFILYF